MIIDKVGQRNKNLCNRTGVDQEKLALKVEIDKTYLVEVVSEKRNLSIKSLEKIINALNISFHDFFEGM